jgi:hypothetical protein
MTHVRAKQGRKARIDPIDVATDYLLRNHRAADVARLHGCSERYVRRCVQIVKRLDTPEARTIQRLANL